LKRFDKEEFERLCLKLYPNLSRQEAIDKLKAEFNLVVVNRDSSKKKAYMINECLLNSIPN